MNNIEFREQVAEELQGVEQRAQGLSADIAGAVQQHVDSGAERFQQHALEAGIRLERRSEEFLRDLQQRLSEENDARHREMQKVQAAVASESSRLQSQTADLGSRITKLGESARQLESFCASRIFFPIASFAASSTCSDCCRACSNACVPTSCRKRVHNFSSTSGGICVSDISN